MPWQAGGSHGRQSGHQCLVLHAYGIDVVTSVLSSICNLQQAQADAEHKVCYKARNVAAQAGYGAEHALMRFDAPDEKTGQQWLGFF